MTELESINKAYEAANLLQDVCEYEQHHVTMSAFVGEGGPFLLFATKDLEVAQKVHDFLDSIGANAPRDSDA